MKRYKFQALVTPYPDKDGDSRAKLSSGSHRMVLRAESSGKESQENNPPDSRIAHLPHAPLPSQRT